MPTNYSFYSKTYFQENGTVESKSINGTVQIYVPVKNTVPLMVFASVNLSAVIKKLDAAYPQLNLKYKTVYHSLQLKGFYRDKENDFSISREWVDLDFLFNLPD
jgi:hypothetical protein